VKLKKYVRKNTGLHSTVYTHENEVVVLIEINKN
jgi:hypothetical protein